MRIGLLRHFPVQEPLPSGWKTAAELNAWRQRYDQAEAIIGQAELGDVAWQSCIASDLPRAQATACAIYSGEIETTPLLREPEFAQFQTGNLRLPVRAWQWVLRGAWLTGHASQRTCRDDFRHRMLQMADRLCTAEQDTLVVSHAGMMMYLSAELRRRGFQGPNMRLPGFAKLYLYEQVANTID